MIRNLSFVTFYLVLVVIFFAIQFFGSNLLGLNAPEGLILKLYLIIGILTLILVVVSLVVKHFNKHHVGSVFLAGMIAKMAIVLALVVVNQEIKQNIIQLIASYFLILLAEVLTFVKILKDKA